MKRSLHRGQTGTAKISKRFPIEVRAASDLPSTKSSPEGRRFPGLQPADEIQQPRRFPRPVPAALRYRQEHAGSRELIDPLIDAAFRTAGDGNGDRRRDQPMRGQKVYDRPGGGASPGRDGPALFFRVPNSG